MSKKVLFLLPYPLHRAPSQRFRVEAFFPVLEENGIVFRAETFLDEKAWDVLYKRGSLVQKAWAVIKGFIRRLFVCLFIAPRFQYVFIHREASPIGPPVFEAILAKLFKKKIIYDFDDAIWIPNTTAENGVVGWIKAAWKVAHICRWAYKVSAGNAFLAGFAHRYNKNVHIVPTCVDVVNRHVFLKGPAVEKPVIGWTGSHSTMPYLDEIVPVLQKIAADFDVPVWIISNKKPRFHFKNLRFIQWTEEREVEDLAGIDIGIMPLKADAWSEGKCGFKLIQYLSVGIPAVASPVGVNKEIISEGVNGFLCTGQEEWYNRLQELIENETLRTSMGKEGRQGIVAQYSIQAQAGAFLGLFA